MPGDDLSTFLDELNLILDGCIVTRDSVVGELPFDSLAFVEFSVLLQELGYGQVPSPDSLSGWTIGDLFMSARTQSIVAQTFARVDEPER